MVYASPVVSAHFVAIGSPLDSFGVTSWSEPAPSSLAPSSSTVPSVASATARAVPESVLAWRERYYAFRAARNRAERGKAAELRKILAGPHGAYVRERFAELAAADGRFDLAAVDCPAPSPRARVDAPEQSSRPATPPVAPIGLPPESEQSPALRQYAAFKRQHPDYLLLMRMGDFYELFGEDARTAGRVLGITVMTRDRGTPNELPMAGVPFHSVEGYLRKLIAAGHRVALAEQVGDKPADGADVWLREVSRLVTPGEPAASAAPRARVDTAEQSSPTAANVAADFVALAARELPAGVTLSRNLERDGLELRFAAKPGGDVRDALKVAGWRWSHASACWYCRADVHALARLRPLCRSITELVTQSPAPAPAQVDTAEPSTSGATASELAAAAALRDYFADVAERLARAAAPLEVASSQNWTPKRGRQWAEKSHNAANIRRAETAAKVLADAWSEVVNGADASSIPPALRGKITKSDLCRRTATRGKSESYYHYCDSFKPQDDSPAAATLRDFVASRSDGAATAERKRAAELNEAIFKLRSLNIPGFFPTPAPLAARVVEAAKLSPGLTVLEPSAGIGDLAEAAREAGGIVTACEILEPAANVLRLKGYDETRGSLHVGDFLAMNPGNVGTFDRVLMNPPFENGAAARHVLHAIAFLEPAGRLVAIVPGNFPASLEDARRGAAGTLAELLASDTVDSWRCSEPIADAFAGAGAFRSTGVGVCILEVVKADSPDAGPRARVDAPEQSSLPPMSPVSPTVEAAAPVAPVAPQAAPMPAPVVDAAPASTAVGGVIVKRAELRKALQSLIAAIPSKVPSKPGVPEITTKRVRLWTVGEVLRVGALDFPNVPTVDVAGVQVDRPMEVGIVGGKVLLDIFALSNDDVMSVSVEGGEIHVRGADSHYTLFTAPVPKSLPGHVAPVDDASHWMMTTAGELAETIRLVEFAASKEGTRYAFNGTAFEFSAGRCDVVTTDGRRLMLQKLAGDVRDVASGTIILERRDTVALRRALVNLPKAAPVHFCVADQAGGVRAVSVIGPALEWRGLELEGKFPPYREVIPQVDSMSPCYTFDVAELAAALKRASTMTSEDSKGLRFTFDVGGQRDRVELVSRNPEQGQTIAHIDAIAATGEPFVKLIAFNPTFLGEALRTVKRGTVRLNLTDWNRPGLFTFDNGARFVLMPVNLQ